MSASASSSPNGRRRRSPRLAQAVAVRIAGRAADGAVLVESTSTCEISRQGASLTTAHRFPVGTAMAIQRAGARPMRARVVSVQPASEAGLQRLGVEFVGDEAHWDFEFPKGWQDSFPAQASPETARPAATRQTIAAADSSLEALVGKAETLRAAAETMLEEFAAQVEAARRTAGAGLASLQESLLTWKRGLEAEIAGQARAATGAIQAELEQSRALLTQQAASLEQKFVSSGHEVEAALHAAQEKYQQISRQQAQKLAETEAQAAAQLEAHRKELAVLETQLARWQEQTAAGLAGLPQETERVLERARADLEALALDSVKQFRKQRIPALAEEAYRFFSNLSSQQKTATTQWVEQELQTARSGFAQLEKRSRAVLQEFAEHGLEEFQASLQKRLQEAREAGEALALPIEARLQRAGETLKELKDWSSQALSAARAEWEATMSQQEARLQESAERHAVELRQAAAAHLQRLEQTRESLEARALDLTRGLDRRARELQETSAALSRQAAERGQELETCFASLAAQYDQRKEMLDRLLGTLEDGRAALRAGLQAVRTTTEENQAGLRRFTAEQETVLKSRALELGQKLQAASVSLEAALQERAAASLRASLTAFSASLEQAARASLENFRHMLDREREKAAGRLSELTATLEQCGEQQRQALATATAGHALKLDQQRQEMEEQTGAALETLSRRTTVEEDRLKQAAVVAAGGLSDHQARAEAAVTEMVAGIEQQRVILARDHAEMEGQVRRTQQSLEARFNTLCLALEEKRAALEDFGSSIEKGRAGLLQSLTGLDQHAQEAYSILHGVQRDIQTALERQAESLTGQMRTTLEESLHASQQELEAMGEAVQGLFQARLQTMVEQTVEAAERLMEKSGDACASSLDGTMQKERRDCEERAQEVARELEESVRRRRQELQESAGEIERSLDDRTQQLSRQALERARELQESILREIAARATEAELAFRQSLDKIHEQALEDASAALRRLSSTLWITPIGKDAGSS